MKKISFDSEGVACAAWLYMPESSSPVPCVVMAHGFSGVKEQRLPAYAERFAQNGMAVLLFDYRHFGESGGEPRQLLSIASQLQDWEAAIRCARSLPGIDQERIALFGSSLSAGHVQTLAARDRKIAAAIAQVPFCDGLINLPRLGLAQALRLTVAGMRDLIGSYLGASPYLVPATGKPGALAMLTSPDSEGGFAALNPPDSTWRNAVCARIALEIARYRPAAKAEHIQCPILYGIGELDQLTPPDIAFAAARRAPRAEVKSYACGHFDVYVSPWWEPVVADQIEFLTKHLLP